jgi:hypothetical protein
MQQGVIADEETRSLEEVMRRSEQDTIRVPRRTNTGTDLDELELAYKLSWAASTCLRSVVECFRDKLSNCIGLRY